MFTLPVLALTLAAAPLPTWHTDYNQAVRQAIKEKKDLVIYFHKESAHLDAVLGEPAVRQRLQGFVCLKVPTSYQVGGRRLLDYGALEAMMGQPGLVVASYHDASLPSYEQVISAHPLVASHYAWVPDYGAEQVSIILDLPPSATLTQRSMLYALRVHPERPQSVFAQLHPSFVGHAHRHSARQAEQQRQHHADILATASTLETEVGHGFSSTSEVVAESWGIVVGGENVLEGAFSCVDAWRHSPGHWDAVSRPHHFFAYDIARGANGTWYATGVFAD